jgi:hypothetical protein
VSAGAESIDCGCLALDAGNFILGLKQEETVSHGA